jgi:hypothetical protein
MSGVRHIACQQDVILVIPDRLLVAAGERPGTVSTSRHRTPGFRRMSDVSMSSISIIVHVRFRQDVRTTERQ